MKRRNVLVGISLACIFIAAIVIPVSFGGGIGLKIVPPEANAKRGSTITYDITISSPHSDRFNLSIIPCSCKIGWFDWTERKQVYVVGGGKKEILLNVTPSEEGDFEFKVKAVLTSNPGTHGVCTAYIHVEPGPNQPPVCACLTPDNKPESKPGEVITWTACAIDPEGDPLQYRFLLSGPGTGRTFTVMQGWQTAYYPNCPTWIWTPDEQDQGLNDIKVEIRDGYHSADCDVWKIYYGYWIGPCC